MNDSEYLRKILTFYPSRADSRTRADAAKVFHAELHAALGLCAEAGEAADLIKKQVFYGRPMDRDALVKELGDALNYLTYLASLIGTDIEEIRRVNVKKLEERVGSQPTYFSGGSRDV